MLHSNRNPYTRVLAAGLAVGCTGAAFAQPNLPLPDGQINFTGSFQEFLVPNRRGTILRFTVYGADGGDATINGACFNFGGQGATALFDTAIGLGATRLNPGQPVRFIVGGAGGRGTDFSIGSGAGQNASYEGGGGGGGSGVVYQSPDVAERNGWVVLSAAGGGGGATTGRLVGTFCTRKDENGQNGRTVRSGGTGNNEGGSGGENGEHGDPSGDNLDGNGGGGGAFGPGPDTPGVDFIGGAGFGPTGDDPVGGAGDTARSDDDADGGDGGYGFGGGGAGGFNGSGGGGGGGYSGGGGGGGDSAGGGGGSFLNAAFQFGVAAVFENSQVGENGRIDYEVIGQAHDSQFNAIELDIDDEGVIETLGWLFNSFPSPIAGVPIGQARDVWYTYTNTSDQIESFRLSGGLDIALVGLINGVNPFVDSGGTLAATLLPGDTIDIRVAEFRPTSGFFTLGGIVFPDADGDGVPDDTDLCPGQDDLFDTDDDGVPDCLDICPGEDDLLDTDADTVPDCLDVCPGFDDLLDTDGDFVPDCLDRCPGTGDLLDADGDGTPDCVDLCPGVDDSLDGNGDGVPDCLEGCPDPDNRPDSDGDGVPDCTDPCPLDPNVVNLTTGQAYPTLTAAIANAAQDDTLELGPCTLPEAEIRVGTLNLTIRGQGMDETVIDGQGNSRILRFFPGDVATIEDLSLVNTRPTGEGGGAATLDNASATFRRIAMERHDGTGRPAAALYGVRVVGLTLESCRIARNMSGVDGSSMLVSANTDSSVLIVNSLFVRNKGGDNQEVVEVSNAEDVVFVNTTFASNDAPFAIQADSPEVFNTVSDTPAFRSSGLATATNSVFPSATGDNIDAEPSFVDAANGDYTLVAGSPGVDYGDPVAYADVGGGDVDILGNPRISDDQDVPNAFEPPIDAGAFEYQAPDGGCSAADIALPFGVLDLGDIDAFIAGFLAGDPLADVADPIGVLDLGDIDTFIAAFSDGCP